MLKLKTIVDLFMVPLENSANSSNPLISQNEVRTIFGNVKELVKLHEELLANFRCVCDSFFYPI